MEMIEMIIFVQNLYDMRTHKNLDVWKNSMDLVVDVYDALKIFPKEEVYGLGSQIKKSAISVPSNIAEGASGKHDKEFIQFLCISVGRLSEPETQFIISQRQGFISLEKLTTLTDNISLIQKQTYGLIRYITNKK